MVDVIVSGLIGADGKKQMPHLGSLFEVPVCDCNLRCGLVCPFWVAPLIDILDCVPATANLLCTFQGNIDENTDLDLIRQVEQAFMKSLGYDLVNSAAHTALWGIRSMRTAVFTETLCFSNPGSVNLSCLQQKIS